MAAELCSVMFPIFTQNVVWVSKQVVLYEQSLLKVKMEKEVVMLSRDYIIKVCCMQEGVLLRLIEQVLYHEISKTMCLHQFHRTGLSSPFGLTSPSPGAGLLVTMFSCWFC